MEILSSSEDTMSEIVEKLKMKVDKHAHLFMLIYMEGCGPCNATRPEWGKIKNAVSNTEIVLADVDSSILSFDDFKKYIDVSPDGFPAMYYICGKKIEKYEDSNIKEKDRSIGSFVEWIESKVSVKGGRRRRTNKKRRKTKNRRKKTIRKSKKRKMNKKI
jgi:hypothetical protein